MAAVAGQVIGKKKRGPVSRPPQTSLSYYYLSAWQPTQRSVPAATR